MEGIIIKVLPLESGVSETGTEWKSREIIIEETGVEFPESVGCRLRGELAESPLLVVNNRVRASISHKARTFTDKNGKERVTTDLKCWALEVGDTRS